MFNSGETGQNRTARGAVHNNCPRVPCFPVSRPFTCATSCTGLWFFGSFLSSVFRFFLWHLSHYSRPVTASVCSLRFPSLPRIPFFPCPSMVSCARPIYAGFNPHKAWGIIDACPVTAGRSCILRAGATFVVVSVPLWSYAIRCHTGRR